MNRKRALFLFLVPSLAFGDTVSLNSFVKNHQLGINPCPPRRLMGMGKRIAIVINCRIGIVKFIGLECTPGEGICPQESRPHPGSKYYERWDITGHPLCTDSSGRKTVKNSVDLKDF